MTADAALLEMLRAFPYALKTQLKAVPRAALDFVPSSWDGVPSEALTIRQQACHLRDIEIDGYAVRVRRTLAEETPLLPSVDTYRLVKERNYAATSPLDALRAFSEARAKTLGLLDGLRPDEFARRADFEDYGVVTLKSLMHFLASHDQQHLAGIQWLLGKFESESRRACFMTA